MALRIAHVSFSSSGGAGGVASRLAEAQRSLGHDAFVVSQIKGSLRDAPWANPLHTLAAGVDDAVIRDRSFAAPISLFRDVLSKDLTANLFEADVIHVHWPNGYLDLEWLASALPTKAVVWTLHDMNAFTGACHYSLGCRQLERGCTACPAVQRMFRPAVAARFRQKKRLFRGTLPWKFVSPSKWLANEAMSSELLSGHPVDVIPNPLPAGLPSATDRARARRELGIDPDSAVFFVSASNLADPVKNIGAALEAFQRAFPGGHGAQMLLAGRQDSHRDSDGIRSLGFLDQSGLALALSASDYIVVTSRAENQPLNIAEAQAMGVSLITLSHTGLTEQADIDKHALLAQDHTELVDILRQGAQRAHEISARSRGQLAATARKIFDPETVAQAYIDTYHSLL